MAGFDLKNYCVILFCCFLLAAAPKPTLDCQANGDVTVAVLKSSDSAGAVTKCNQALRHVNPKQAGSIARKLRAVRKMCFLNNSSHKEDALLV